MPWIGRSIIDPSWYWFTVQRPEGGWQLEASGIPIKPADLPCALQPGEIREVKLVLVDPPEAEPFKGEGL